MALDLNKTNLYALLGVSEDATEKELVKAYRKSALKCHPDKNPDNPEAANEFQKLSKALEVLSDAAARAAYDKTRKAKKAAEERHKVLDSKRKKFKEDLEARERGAQPQDQRADDVKAQKNFEAEIERLRKQGSSLLEKEQEYLKEQLKKDIQHVQESYNRKEGPEEQRAETAVSPKLKITWKVAKDDVNNGGYSHGMLRSMFGKYGEVTALVLSETKKGRGIVEYKLPRAAALAIKNVTGLKENPLTLKWLSGKPEIPAYEEPSSFGVESSDVPFSFTSSQGSFGQGFPMPSEPEVEVKQSFIPKTSQDRDFESLVLMKMRQAEERKRLIEQMQKEDEES